MLNRLLVDIINGLCSLDINDIFSTINSDAFLSDSLES